jgi:glycosyltransferase involved in cell wall biosynthesis
MKVSIILPTYNASKYLLETLDSIESQVYDNIELIAIDNESKDNSYQILKDHKSKFPYIVEKVPNIYPHSWQEPVERAFEIMSGEWFMIMGADDLIKPNYIFNNVKAARALEDKCFQSHLFAINEKGEDLYQISHTYKNIYEFKKLFLKKCPVNTPSLFMHESIRKYYKMESDIYMGAGDYNVYGNFADNDVYIYPIPFYLGYAYRIHPNQVTWNMHKYNMDEKIQEKWKKRWKI